MKELDQARAILCRLEAAGYCAYFVGGCVRDRLLGRPVHDWDIATSAEPEAVMRLFARCIPTGLQHGTVTVREGGISYEVTTFRTDGEYRNHRSPEAVQFVRSLESDLARRDFTINAMAMDASDRLTDLFDGRTDLRARRIRCVGQPRQRFAEDALRMLRAVRFAAQLDFTIDGETMDAMTALAPLCAGLSAERVRDELERTLLSPRPEAAGEMLRLGMLRQFHLDGVYDLSGLVKAPPERATRWTALKLAVPELDFMCLRLDKKTALLCQNAASAYRPHPSLLDLKRTAARFGWDAAWCAARLAGCEALLKSAADSGQCMSLRELAVTGRDLDWLSGRAVGEMLERLLEHVLEHPQDNIPQRLRSLAAQWTEPTERA